MESTQPQFIIPFENIEKYAESVERITARKICQACGETRRCIMGDLHQGWSFFICLPCISNLGTTALLMDTPDE